MGPEEEEAGEPHINANSFEEPEQPAIADKIGLSLSLGLRLSLITKVNNASDSLMKFDDEVTDAVSNNHLLDKDCAEFALPMSTATPTEHPVVILIVSDNARKVGKKQNDQKNKLHLHVENRVKYGLESGMDMKCSKDISEQNGKGKSDLKVESKCGKLKRKGLNKKKRWLQGTFLCNFQHADSYKVDPTAEPEFDEVLCIDTTSQMKGDIATGHTCTTPVDNDSECNTANSHHNQNSTGNTTTDNGSDSDNHCDSWWEEFEVPDEDATYSKIEMDSSSPMVLDFELSNARPGFGTARCKIFRRKTKWKKQKARQQIKTKYLNDIKHARGKHMCISRRVLKKVDLPIREPNTSSTRSTVCASLPAKSTLPSKPVPPVKASIPKKQQNQGPLLALDTNTASDDLKQALESEGHASARLALLIELQHRDITPEDYDLLLVLDAQIAASTAAADVTSSLKSRVLTEDELQQLPVDTCAVCLCEFAEGDKVSLLPCCHYFHTPCIKRWLENSSPNCPLDGVPVEPS